mgnify:CR=1 FL=1
MSNLNIIKFLCYSGLIPFYCLSFLNFYFKSFIIIDIFSIYSLVILSFLFGSTWLYLIIIENKINIKLYLFFVILSPIFLILCEMFLKIEIRFFIYAIFYFVILKIDSKFMQNFDYLRIRKNLTILVIFSHIIMLISIYSSGVWDIF